MLLQENNQQRRSRQADTTLTLIICQYFVFCEKSMKQVSSCSHLRFSSYKQLFPQQLLYFLS